MFKNFFALTLTLLIVGTSNAMTDGKDSKLPTHNLHYLAKTSHHEAFKRALIEIKAAIDVSHISDQERKLEFAAVIDQLDGDGCTPLHYAARYGREKYVELLIRAGAKIDQSDRDGWTPLRLAVWNGHEKCVVALMLYGADATKVNKQKTAWHLAGHAEVIAAFDTTPHNYIPTTKAALPAMVASSLNQPLPPVLIAIVNEYVDFTMDDALDALDTLKVEKHV